MGGTLSALQAFRVPRSLLTIAKWALPIFEIVIGLSLLLTGGTTYKAAVLAAVLFLLAVTGLVLITLGRGEHPECHCFGAVNSRPIDGLTVVRNVIILALVSGLLLIPEWAGVVSVLAASDTTALTLLGVAILFVAWLSKLWSRQAKSEAELAELKRAFNAAEMGPAAARPIPAATLVDGSGRQVELVSLVTERAAVVLFVSGGCSGCHQVMPNVPLWRERLQGEVQLITIAIGDADRAREAYPDEAQAMLLDTKKQALNELGVAGTPAMFLLGMDGTVVAGPAHGAQEIKELMVSVLQAVGANLVAGVDHRTAQATRPQATIAVGDVLPAVSVNSSSGTGLLGDHLLDDEEQVLVAWRTGCPHCDAMVGDFAELPADGSVLLLTNDSPEKAVEAGLKVPVLQIKGMAMEHLLGVPGTPSAVTVRGGKVTKAASIGGAGVLSDVKYRGAQHAGADEDQLQR
ncbi:thioredoxin family protein [Ornithinimicrobium sp. Arc0846-15]|nr:thioredoxin family protein [Ornithinimicrobium laminariae]